MAKGKKNVGENGVSQSPYGISSEVNNGMPVESQAAVATQEETATGEAESSTAGTPKKDRSNPPVYGIVGIRPNDEGMDLLATFPTRHQMQKNLAMVKRMVSRSYSALEYVKIKYLDMQDVES